MKIFAKYHQLFAKSVPTITQLFTIVLDDKRGEAYSKRREINWSLSHQLEDVDYADEICLLSHIQAKIRGFAKIGTLCWTWDKHQENK